MITHYLKVAVRNLIKYKTQSLISIIGLSIGFTCFALSALWIHYERTYDDFHEGAERIYLVGSESKTSGDQFSYYTSSLLAEYIINNCPEVENACHIYYEINGNQAQYNGNQFQMQQIGIDSCFMTMFNIRVLDGNNFKHLENNQIAITDKAAKRIFGEESPIGKQLLFPQNGNEEKMIIAVVKSWEGHSLFPFDILMPFHDWKPDWGRMQCQTFARITPGSDSKTLEQRLTNCIVDQTAFKRTLTAPIALLSTLRSTHPRENMNVRVNHIYLFAFIGVLVIICGLCNYLTMLITCIRIRNRELALRKVNGATNGSLLVLLLSELLMLLVISAIIGCLLAELILPTFKQLSQIDENTSFFYSKILVYMLALIVITIGVASLLVRYICNKTLHSNITRKCNVHTSSWFYKSSILFQLIISMSFVFCTVVMMKQLNFLLQSRELGIERHNVGVLACTYDYREVSFESLLKQIPDIEECLYGFNTPIPKSRFMTNMTSVWDENESGESINIECETMNKSYADFFHIEVKEGSMLEEKDGEKAALINETAKKKLGWHQAIGKKICLLEEEYVIKGVIKDIYYNSPIFPVAPAIYYLPDSEEADFSDIIFKVKESTWDKVTQRLTNEVQKIVPNAKLWFYNMEEVYNKNMKSEKTLSKLLVVVSSICIIIAVFGIFSLVTLSCEQRRKEIAIRKVNGATVTTILNMFFKQYLALLLIASLIAFPLGYIIMKQWLEGYMKQTPINFWIYICILGGITLVIFLSIIWRVWKAARQNPAEVIKNE